jgi:hypothetical protein
MELEFGDSIPAIISCQIENWCGRRGEERADIPWLLSVCWLLLGGDSGLKGLFE